jgi:hypothetical protein
MDPTREKFRSEHRRLWRNVRKRFRRGLKEGDEKELKLVKLAADALLDIAKGEREAWDSSGDGFTTEELECFAEKMDALTASPRAGAALDRAEKV